ncbi:MAG TPA: hypothetical protein VN698_11720, partial [Bacteroidia bacterium]|nr:hypothetical protein [Bacteroidia bacterium]
MSQIIREKIASISIKTWLILLLVPCFQLKAQDNPPNDTIRIHFPTDTIHVKKSFVKKVIYEVSKKRKFLLAPELGRSPLTGFYTGIYYLQLFKLKGDTDSRTSNIETYGTVTEKNQFYLTFNNTVLFDKEKYFWRGNTYISKFNEYFYGIGNNIDVHSSDLIN